MLNDMKKIFEVDDVEGILKEVPQFILFYFDFKAKPRSDLPEDPMNVSKQHLELMLTKVLTVPRNHQYDKVSALS